MSVVHLAYCYDTAMALSICHSYYLLMYPCTTMYYVGYTYTTGNWRVKYNADVQLTIASCRCYYIVHRSHTSRICYRQTLVAVI
jgi:hypothetical protein